MKALTGIALLLSLLLGFVIVPSLADEEISMGRLFTTSEERLALDRLKHSTALPRTIGTSRKKQAQPIKQVLGAVYKRRGRGWVFLKEGEREVRLPVKAAGNAMENTANLSIRLNGKRLKPGQAYNPEQGNVIDNVIP